MALIFWREKWFRRFFLVLAFLFGITCAKSTEMLKWFRRFFLVLAFLFGISVLLAHVHYSIDVFAAPFITYGVFVITSRLFKRDYALIAPPSHSLAMERSTTHGI